MTTIFYFAGAFYDPAIHDTIPDGAVEISPEAHAALLHGQSLGLRIADGANGEPILAEPPAPTFEELKRQFVDGIQVALDSRARAWGYDDIRSAVTYIGDPHPQFNAEAVALRDWRSSVWVWAEAQQQIAGIDALVQSVDDLLKSMPEIPARPSV